MALSVVVSFRLVIINFESVLGVRLVVDNLVLPVSVNERIPALHVTIAVGHFVALLRILVVARSEAELVTLRSMEALRCGIEDYGIMGLVEW